MGAESVSNDQIWQNRLLKLMISEVGWLTTSKPSGVDSRTDWRSDSLLSKAATVDFSRVISQ